MVVEGDPGIRALTVNALSYCVNRDVISFDDGLSAWHYFEAGNPADLVIADMDLPGMDGLTLMENFKLKWQDGIFICMSSRLKNDSAAESAGADAFLGKPFTVNDLFRIVQKYVVN